MIYRRSNVIVLTVTLKFRSKDTQSRFPRRLSSKEKSLLLAFKILSNRLSSEMGLLFAKLMTVFGDREHKVIIVGLDNAGKTTILYQFLTKEAVQTTPTIGSNVEEIAVKKTRFLVWDIGGQDSLRATWNSYYCNTEIVIMVVDSTDRERLTLNKEELHRMLAHEDLQDASVLVLANKQDMKNSMSAAEISQCLTLSSLNARSWHVQACCALTGEGLPASLDWMRSRVVAN